jgi:hypothetical protein
MNSHQRRIRRRSRGIRPPYECLWCGAVVSRLGRCPGCQTVLKPVDEYSTAELAARAHANGTYLEFRLVPQENDMALAAGPPFVAEELGASDMLMHPEVYDRLMSDFKESL